MTAQLRAELRKMATTRTNLGLLLGVVALILLGVMRRQLRQRGRLSPVTRISGS